MTAEHFRKLALEIPGSIESAHMGHPDFRLKEKIFATLGYPSEAFGMVKLTPEQQRAVMAKEPGSFHPCNGAWGRDGATNVRLAGATEEGVRAALKSAAENVGAAKAKKAAGKKPAKG
jgi:hypothetical protein